MRIKFIHSHIEELAESLIQDLNHNNKYNVKKSHFPFINNGIILKSLIHSHIEELAESLIQDLNHNNKYNVKKSHFPFINNGIILKLLIICPF